MTYLEMVNKVLTLMREPTVIAFAGADVVAELVMGFVNDAKDVVEDAHNWNALRHSWSESVAEGASTFTLTDSGRLPMLEEGYTQDGRKLEPWTLSEIRQRKYNTQPGYPVGYTVDGQVGGNVQIRLNGPTDTAYTLDFYGFRKQDALVIENETTLVPPMPIVYHALANALRERGEVGGQTAAEIFGVANQYLRDAIAQDASLNDLEYNWYS